MPDEKAALRTEVSRVVTALSPARRCAEEDLVTAAIQATPQWREAKTVFLYRSVPPEFTTVGLANGAWRAGKRLLFPRIEGTGKLALHEVHAWHEFTGATHGIPEPAATSPRFGPEAVDLSIIPGVAFTPDGQRLGRGGGYYDRLLPRLRLAWGVAFDGQVVPRLPLETHDQRVHRVWHAAAVSA